MCLSVLKRVYNFVWDYINGVLPVVLNKVCILGFFCPKQGQGFKPPAAHLYPIIKFSTLDNALLAFWLVYSISVISSYTLVWPYMVNDYAECCQAKKFLQGNKISLGQNVRKKQISQAFYWWNTKMLENAILAATN